MSANRVVHVSKLNAGLRRHFPRRLKVFYRKVSRRYYAKSSLLRHKLDDQLESLNLHGEKTFEVHRTPMAQRTGASTLFLNIVDLDPPGDDRAQVRLVEKGIWSASNEAAFWRNAEAEGWRLEGERYGVIRPVKVVDRGAATIFYLPYLPSLNRSRDRFHAEFQENLNSVTAAVARLNGNNAAGGQRWSRSRYGQFRFPRKPTAPELRNALHVSPHRASELREVWEEIREHWHIIETAYERVPTCLCHSDVSPGNVIVEDGRAVFVDLGMARVGPIGSDLHTIIRWSGIPLNDATNFYDLLGVYLSELNSSEIVAEFHEAWLAAWTTFFLRYGDLRWQSSRDAEVYSLALYSMRDLIRVILAS